MANKIDLHTHTTASDGTLTPTELVAHARELGLSAVAITDHDTMNGVAEAQTAGERLGVEVIPGMEISTDYRGEDTHVLGYGMDINAPALREVLDWVIEDRRRRNEKIAERMHRDGIDVSLEELEAQNPGATIGRPHFARVLVAQGIAGSVPDAFARFLSTGKRYYLPRTYIPMKDAIKVIQTCGGTAVLAHPLQYGYSEDELHTLVRSAAEAGMSGMEIYYTGYTAEQIARLSALAAEFDLFATGGSDFHGANKPDIELGRGHRALVVPSNCLTDLKAHMLEEHI